MTADQARARILHKHGLAESIADPVAVVESCVGVQTQYAASLPVAVSARAAKAKAGWDFKALQCGALIKSWTLRSTIHVHTPEDYRLMLEAFGAMRRKRFERWMSGTEYLAGASLNHLEDRILAALDDGPLTRTQIHEHVPEFKGMPMVGWGLDVMGLAYLGRIVLLTPEKGATQFKKVEPIETIREPNDAAICLMRRYIETHGPATVADFAYWAGMPSSRVRPAFEALRDELREVHVDGHPVARYMLASDQDVGEAKGMRLLAKFDPLIMGYGDKSLFLDPKFTKDVSRPAGQVEATVLENGRVTGTWRLQRSGSKAVVLVKPFTSKCLKSKAATERQLARLKSGLGLKELDLVVEA